MPKKTLSINFPIERVVLSDLLPYEVPITFSNRSFYNFIIDNKLKCSGDYFFWRKKDDAFDRLVMLLLGVSSKKEVKIIEEDGEKYSKVNFKERKASTFTIPFTFDISHKQDQYRHLSLIHPRSQVIAIEFYKKTKI